MGRIVFQNFTDACGQDPRHDKKKVGEKWVNMDKPEIMEYTKAFEAKKGAQPLAGPKTDLEKRLSKKE